MPQLGLRKFCWNHQMGWRIFLLAWHELKDTIWFAVFCQKRFHWLTQSTCLCNPVLPECTVTWQCAVNNLYTCVIICDDYYKSLRLFIDSWQLGVGATGTVQQNRKGVWQVIKDRKLGRKGETVVYESRQLTITKYLDANPVSAMSTAYPSNDVTTGKTDSWTHIYLWLVLMLSCTTKLWVG